MTAPKLPSLPFDNGASNTEIDIESGKSTEKIQGLKDNIRVEIEKRDTDLTTTNDTPKIGKWTRRGLTPTSFKLANHGDASSDDDGPIKPRHVHAVALGGCVGAGMFIGCGTALATGGPLSLLIGFSLVSIMIILVVQATGELAVRYPSSGSLYAYPSRFIHPSWGFAIGWNYALMWAFAIPLLLTVAAITISYWKIEMSMASWIAIFLALLAVVSLFGVAGYGEEEFWATFVKVGMIVIFLVVGIICDLGKGPADGKFNVYQGTKTWIDPGYIAHGLKGVCSVFVSAAFAINGTELIGVVVAELPNPAKAFPTAVKQVAWRCIIFYIVSFVLLGLLVPWTDSRLLSTAAEDSDIKASPFVIVAEDAGLPGLAHFFNLIILISVLSVAVAAIYAVSKTLSGLAKDGIAPKCFAMKDLGGRYPWCIVVCIVFANVAFISQSSSGVEAFEWMLGLTGLCAFFNWGSICVSHIVFRKLWKRAGRTPDELAYRAPFGVAGSVVGLILIILALIAQFYIAVSPIGRPATAEAFFKAFLAVPAIVCCALGHYVWTRWKGIKSEPIPLDFGAREYVRPADADDAVKPPMWKRVLGFFF